jgi:hypothetical protein
MQSELLDALRARAPEIRARWAELLRVEPVNTPLAHPEALAHLIDWTIEDIFQGLAAVGPTRHGSQVLLPSSRPECPCGRNPLLAYFHAAEQVMREALVLVQSEIPHLDPLERDASLLELNLVLRNVARREIETFCGVCQHRRETLHATCPSSNTFVFP